MVIGGGARPGSRRRCGKAGGAQSERKEEDDGLAQATGCALTGSNEQMVRLLTCVISWDLGVTGMLMNCCTVFRKKKENR
jgi:hypothetical protein